jgi:putative multiple sugar transport system substrate-binding protein
MYCTSCGANNPDGSVFCSVCGAKMDDASQIAQQPYGQPTLDQPTYGQQPYGQPPKKGKAKTVLLIAGGAVLLAAIVLVLIFVVFPGDKKVSGDEDGLLSEKTMQAEFINDGTEVFSNAFSGLGGVDTERYMNESFDAEMEYSVEVSGFPMEMKMTAVYDQEKLGMLAEVTGQEVVLLLDEDTLYTSIAGEATGYRFDTDEEMSAPMPLKERIEAMIKSLPGDSSGDYMVVIEAMLGSISEDCFDKSAGETTLKLTPDDMIDMLNTLEEKAEKDDDLSDAMENLELDIDDAIDSMEEEDFEVSITVGYDDDTPVSLEIDYDDGTETNSFNLQFGYEDTEDSREISLNVTAGSQEIKGKLNVEKDGDEVRYDGELNVLYSGTSETYTLEGSESWDGDEVDGSMTVADSYSNSYTIEYGGTVVFGMPEDMVEDDGRFDVDTGSADVLDISDLIGMEDLGTVAVPEESPWTTAPVVSEVPTTGSGEGKLVGISLPTNSLQRWIGDGARVQASLEEMGYEVDLQYADNTADTQYAQIENQITMGCDVLVIAAVDGSVMGGVLTEAAEADIPVIAYDRLLTDTDKCDYFVTFSRYDVGRIQGEYIISTLGLDYSGTDTYTLECFAGDSGDPNALLYYQGAMDALQPYVDNGTLVVESGQIDMADIATQRWDSARAQERMDSLLTAYYKKENIDAVLSPNDSIAQGIVIALKSAGYGTDDKPYPILTGQDCDKVSIGMISRGEQSMSVFLDTVALADQIILTVDAVLSGKEAPVNTEYDNGIISVPSYNCDIITVGRDNWKEVLIDTGYYDISDIPQD